jgi:hypothetical protein
MMIPYPGVEDEPKTHRVHTANAAPSYGAEEVPHLPLPCVLSLPPAWDAPLGVFVRGRCA